MEVTSSPSSVELDRLLQFGGFPEPYLAQDERTLRFWQRDRLSRIIREDLRDLERVHEVSLVEYMVDLLPDRVGAPLSIKSIREDLEIDHKTVERWLQILENLYICYRISSFGSPKIRAVKKSRKLYLWDWSMVPEMGFRFENLVASQLLKFCHWMEDTEGYRMELRFIRDTDEREIDFVVLQDKHPLFAVECKTGEKAISRAIHYFAARTKIPHFYQVHRGTQSYTNGKITVQPFWEFCRDLKMP
jgi:uncharacterized protein